MSAGVKLKVNFFGANTKYNAVVGWDSVFAADVKGVSVFGGAFVGGCASFVFANSAGSGGVK